MHCFALFCIVLHCFAKCKVQNCYMEIQLSEMHSKIQSRNAVKLNKIFIYQRSTLAIRACPWELDLFICSSQIFYQLPIESSSDIKASNMLIFIIEKLYWLFMGFSWGAGGVPSIFWFSWWYYAIEGSPPDKNLCSNGHFPKEPPELSTLWYFFLV